MSRIPRAEVERVALLARLQLGPAELERMERDLAAILDYVDTLGRVDTSGIEPTAHVLPLATPLRDDAPEVPLDPARALAGAPEISGSAFVVPEVIGSEEDG